MRPSALVYMYVRRLRAHGAQELMAGVGIAIAVALVLSATVAERSISKSAREVVHTVIGPAQLQLRARSEEGFAESTQARVEHLPGVERAAPVLEQAATISTAGGHTVRAQLAGADLRLATLDGLGETLPIGTLTSNRIALSLASARALGIPGSAGASTRVTVRLRGAAYRLRVSTVLGAHQAGALSQALVAVMPLTLAQRLSGLPARVSRILVQAKPGQTAAVKAELRGLVASRARTRTHASAGTRAHTRTQGTPPRTTQPAAAEVAKADQDVALLAQALGPSDLASGLFGAIGGLLGFLLAFNAMLLTVGDRRKAIADLRVAGARRATIVEMVGFEALCLGLTASVVGVAVGWALANGLFHQATGYLAQAFTLTPDTVLDAKTVTLALAGGVVATGAACALPLLDLRRGRARDAIYKQEGSPGSTLTRSARTRLAGVSLALLTAASVLWAIEPTAAIPATALLALATVTAVPLVFAAVLAAAARASERWQGIAILPLALASLRATTVRSLALAATGAVALFGSVALGGLAKTCYRASKRSRAAMWRMRTSGWGTPAITRRSIPSAPGPTRHASRRWGAWPVCACSEAAFFSWASAGCG